jgi:enoyl-CoA hydratase/carnithine racemase
MSHIVTETRDRVARIELARLDKKNALTAEMYAAMADALAAAEADRDVRAILIHGAPDCFAAGNDLADFVKRPSFDDSAPVMRFMRAIATAAKPIVAAVGGPAVGIGTTMLLHCDLVYAAPKTRFQLPFVGLGIIPEAGSSMLLPMIAGYQRAAELMLLGKPFDAEKAMAAGFVNEIVAPESLLERARQAALDIAALPPASVRLTKQFMKQRYARPLAELMVEEAKVLTERVASPEAQEAFSAFFEKRKPDFSRF